MTVNVDYMADSEGVVTSGRWVMNGRGLDNVFMPNQFQGHT